MASDEVRVNLRKFHFVPAASSTSKVLMPTRLKMMLSSRDQRDVDVALGVLDDLEASATLMLEARWVPAFTTRS